MSTLIERADGSWSTLEAFELDQRIAMKVAQIRSDYLNGVRPRRPKASDHCWHPLTLVCLDCGMTSVAFHNEPTWCKARPRANP